MKVRRVAIIGAGAAGHVAAKELIAQGMTPVLYEQRRELGGLWSFDPQAQDGGGPAYLSLRANTSARTFAFSDHPLGKDPAAFPLRTEVLDYLHSYAVRFGLLPHLRLGTTVTAAKTTAAGGRQHS